VVQVAVDEAALLQALLAVQLHLRAKVMRAVQVTQMIQVAVAVQVLLVGMLVEVYQVVGV
jgi:hypothetical protein